MMMIKILIADDQQLIQQSLAMLLESREQFHVTDTVGNGFQVLESIKKEQPDIILMDIRMPLMDGVVCTETVKRKYPDIKIIILTTFDDDEYIYKALKNGASGYLLKGSGQEDLFKAIETVYGGQSMINPDIAYKVINLFYQMANEGKGVSIENVHAIDTLTETELKIIHEVEKGASNKEIADRLCLSQGTVRNYLSTILDKLELRDRTQLAIWAIQNTLKS